MSKRFRNGSMQFASAVMLAAVLAGVVCVATSGLANETKFATTSVDRMHKGDRLSPASGIAWPQDNSKATKAPTIVPAGCDRAFSPVAEPERSRIFGRCIT
jgi:hypothetical protein